MIKSTNLTEYTYNNYSDLKSIKNGTIYFVEPNPKPIISDSISHAITHIKNAEMYDKTFLLIFTLTIAWSSWHNDDHDHDHGDEDKDTGEKKAVFYDKNDDSKSHGHIVGY